MPQNDPWDEEAAKFKGTETPAATSTATAAPDDHDDYSIWNKTNSSGDSSDPNQDWRDRVAARIADPSMTPDPQGTLKGSIERFGQGAAQGLTQPFLHPIKTLEGAAEATPAGAVFDLATRRPNASQQQAQDLVNGMRTNPAGTVGQVAGGVAAGGVVGAGADAAGGVVSRFRNIRPTSAPNIVPPVEMAARKLINAIGPAENRAPAMIKAASIETPNVLGYAARTDNPLNTRLEFVKAAEGNAEESRGHYEDNILGPNANEKVPAPQGSEVQSMPGGENPQNRVTTLGNIDKRVVDINKELDNPKLNASDTRRASDTELMAEKSQLLDILHRSLSDLTGIPPEEIADLRQRVGRSRELANDTNAAVTRQGLQEAKPAAVGGLPTGLGDVAMRGVNAARGGPTAISDRAFQDAIKDFPGQAKPLPKITGPKQQTPVAASRFYRPQPATTEIPTVNTADPAAQQATRATNVSRFQSNQAAQQAAADAERKAILAQQDREAANRATAGKRLQILAQQNGGASPENPDIPSTIQPEKQTFDGKASVAASVPSEVNDLLERTGAKITNNEAPTSKVVASVDPDEPNNINIDDKERFSKDKNAAAQTLSHEAVHVWHNNLPPEIQKMIPADDPKDPYHKNGYEPDELQNMRAQGLKLYNLPRERAATVIQKYSHLGGSNAPKEVRDVYEPWAKDMVTSPLSTVMPTSGNQEGINTDVRPPGSAPMPETSIFPEEKSEEKKEKADGEKAGPKHPSGDVTGWDEESGLPIVKRKSGTKEAKPEPKEEKPEPKPAKEETPTPKGEPEHKYKFGNTQVDLPTDSDAHKAIKAMQAKIPPEYLSEVHEDQDKPHVTVRYGVKDGENSKMKDYLSKQAPFEAKLGKTMAFPVSEHSEGAAPIVAQVHSPDLHRMNREIEKHGDFEPSNFPDYKPHVTVAYVKPEHAAKYVGMNDGEGKTFKVGSVGVGDRDGNKEDVKLSGDVPALKSNPKGDGESEQAKPPEKSGGESSFKVGDKVTLPDGTGATVAYVPSKNSQLPTYRFKTEDGKTRELRTSQMGRVKPAEESADGKTPPPGHTVVTSHFRKLPGK